MAGEEDRQSTLGWLRDISAKLDRALGTDRDANGTWDYIPSTDEDVDGLVPDVAGARLVSLAIVAGESGATYQINDGPEGALEANQTLTVAPRILPELESIELTGTTAYFVEVIR